VSELVSALASSRVRGRASACARTTTETQPRGQTWRPSRRQSARAQDQPHAHAAHGRCAHGQSTPRTSRSPWRGNGLRTTARGPRWVPCRATRVVTQCAATERKRGQALRRARRRLRRQSTRREALRSCSLSQSRQC